MITKKINKQFYIINKFLRSIITFSLFLVFSLSSFASTKKCIQKEWFEHSDNFTMLGRCQFLEPKLTKGYFYYPKFSLPDRLVEYWSGGYKRNLYFDRLFLVKSIDHCSKPPGLVVDYKWITQKKVEIKEFNLSNPNLDPELKYSFLLSPMTEGQVQDELPLVKEKCESFSYKDAVVD